MYIYTCVWEEHILSLALSFSSPAPRLVDVGKPVVVVLTHGAPVVSAVYAKASAVLSAGYAGQGSTTTRRRQSIVSWVGVNPPNCAAGKIVAHVQDDEI